MSYPKDSRRDHRDSRQQSPPIDVNDIVLATISAELFNEVARQKAIAIAGETRSNKPTQLRKFYDEIVMWETKVMLHEDKMDEYLPFIRMLNAKVAYAMGRKLVSANYAALLNHCLQQVQTPQTMRNFKLFMEAFMGFYKQERPKD